MWNVEIFYISWVGKYQMNTEVVVLHETFIFRICQRVEIRGIYIIIAGMVNYTVDLITCDMRNYAIVKGVWK